MKHAAALHDLVVAVAVFGLYWLAAQLGFVFSNQGILTPVWPAAAVAVSAAILYGPRSLWLAIIYVFVDIVDWRFLEIQYLRRGWIEPLGVFVSANVVAAFARRLPLDLRFNTLRQVGYLVAVLTVYAGVNGVLVTAGYCGVINVPSCAKAGVVSYWWQAFAGDFFGCLIVMPALISWARRLDTYSGMAWSEGADATPLRLRLEVAQWRFVGCGLLCIVLGWWGTHVVHLPVSAVGFLVLPLLVWAALQFRPLFVHTTILATGLIAISLQLTASSVMFQNPKAELTSLFLFLLSASVLTLIVNVIVQQQQALARALVLRQEQERIDLMLQAATDAVLSFDSQGQVTYLNPAAQRVLGRDGLQLHAAGILAILPTPRLTHLERDGIAALAQADPDLFSGQVFEMEIPSGKDKVLILEVALTAYQKSGTDHATAFVRDVTLRQQQQEELKKTTGELESILQSTLVGITHTIARVHVWANRKFAEMLGYPAEDIIGRSTRMFYLDEHSWLELGALSDPVLSAGQPFVTEWPLRRQDGSMLWCEMHGNNVDPGDRSKGEIWSFLDISERKLAESELRRALLHQQELNEIKSRFVAMTSHEFRTPLSTILSSSDLLDHYSERLPAEEKQALHRGIQTAVQRMTAMMNDVLTIGQAETRGFDLKLAPVDLSSFCLGLVEEFRLSLPAGIAINYQAPQCYILQLDSQLLRRVLANLLSNAVKYSPQGGSVGFSVQYAGNELVFQVSDQGIGVPAEDLPKLFESFHRATNVGTISGTGLGLSIVKKSVDRQGGTIEVSSALGQGTRFVVRIPLPQEPFV